MALIAVWGNSRVSFSPTQRRLCSLHYLMLPWCFSVRELKLICKHHTSYVYITAKKEQNDMPGRDVYFAEMGFTYYQLKPIPAGGHLPTAAAVSLWSSSPTELEITWSSIWWKALPVPPTSWAIGVETSPAGSIYLEPPQTHFTNGQTESKGKSHTWDPLQTSD